MWKDCFCFPGPNTSGSDVIFPVLLAEVGEGDRVLDVDGELLRVAEHGRVQGEQLVILHRTPGRDLTQGAAPVRRGGDAGT